MTVKGAQAIPTPITISAEYRPGLLGRLVEMHGAYYARHWGFGLYFEAKVAEDIIDFLRALPNPDACLWHALQDETIVGAVGIDGRDVAQRSAQLRWFIIDESARGQGLGRKLLSLALAFCHTRAYRSVSLWTFAGLDTARHLYESFGFQLVEQREGITWGIKTLEQRFVLALQERPAA